MIFLGRISALIVDVLERLVETYFRRLYRLIQLTAAASRLFMF